MRWWHGDEVETHDQFVATVRAYKYANKWEIWFDKNQSLLDSLTIDDWNLAYSNVTDDKAYAFDSGYGTIIIRNGNKVFAKVDFDLTWLNNVKS